MIITYLEEPDEPRLIAEFSNWDFNAHPKNTDFSFEAPADARQVELKSPDTAKPNP
jgi:hypothetical protein